MDESILNLYARFNKYKALHQFEISENIIFKVNRLYEDIMFQKDSSEFKVSYEAKEKLFRQTCQLFLTHGKITGQLDIKFNEDIFWKERQLTLDIDIGELMISSEKQQVLDLRQYSLKQVTQDNKRYKFTLSHKNQTQLIHFAGKDEEYVMKWFKQMQQCNPDNNQKKTVEVMNIQPMTKQINFELLKQLEQRKSKSDMYRSQEIQQQKHYSIMCNQEVPSDPQSPMFMGSLNALADIDKKIIKQENLIMLHQVQLGESQQINYERPVPQEPHELPEFFAEFNDKLTYKYMTDESDFVLFQFEDQVRIMQHRNDPYNFRVYLPLSECNLKSLVQGLYDCQTQTKWNKQIKQIDLIIHVTKTQAKIKETRQTLGYFYQPRTFQYLRLFYKDQDSFYVIDKSDDEGGAKIYWHICSIFSEHGVPKLLVIDTKTINGGYITQQQDFNLTCLYLKEYAHYTQFSIELSLHQQTLPGMQEIFLQLEVNENKQYEKPLIAPQQKQLMFQSQPIFENQTFSHSKIDSDAYLQIKQKYMAKIPMVSENKHTSIDLPQNPSPRFNNEEQKIISFRRQESAEVKLEQNLPIQQEETLQTEEDLRLDNASDIELDQEFVHEDIRPEEERSQLILNQDEHYRELLEFVLQSKMYQSQLHTFATTINEKTDFHRIGDQNYFYKDEWVFDLKKGYLKFVNAKKLDAQKKVFKYILGKIGSNIFKGKSILSISLPVYVFEKRTNLQRFGDSFAFAPHFLENVPSDPIKQMSAVICFSLSFTILYLNLEKPFNPILGETCQLWVKGCPIYLEQISHHPPIAAFQMYGRGYKIHGNLESTASFGPNTITGGNIGKIVVEFADSKIEFSYCKGYVSGITYGDRYFYTEGQQIYLDTRNETISELFFNPQKKGKNQFDYFEGKIYKVDKTIIQKFKKDGKIKMASTQCKVLAEIDGNWQQEHVMRVNGVTMFNLFRDLPYKCKPESDPIASDSQYREDLIGWQLDDFELAMKHKELLENRQRKDRKLRV